MSEGKQFETPPKSNEPQSIEALLEKGEIESIHALKGFERYDLVKIKDDGGGLFRPTIEDNKYNKNLYLRKELELLVFAIDNALEFDLVPTVVNRDIEDRNGSLQRFIKDDGFEVANLLDWQTLVEDTELMKAAVFDFLIDSKDRNDINFMFNPVSKRIKLIDHDYYMLINFAGHFKSFILSMAIKRGLIKLPEEIKRALENLLGKIDSIMGPDSRPEIRQILDGVKERAEKLIATGILV